MIKVESFYNLAAILERNIPALDSLSHSEVAFQVFFISLAFFTALLTSIFFAMTKFEEIRFYCIYTWTIAFVLVTESPVRDLFFSSDLYITTFLLSHCLGGSAMILFFGNFCEKYIDSKGFLFRLCFAVSCIPVVGALIAPSYGVLFLLITGSTTSAYLFWIILGVLRTAKTSTAFKIYIVSVNFLIVAVGFYLLRISGLYEWPLISGFELLLGQTIEIFGGLVAVGYHYLEFLSDKKRQEIMLNEQLNQHKRLSSLGLMAGGLAHEINTPLSIIKMASSNLEFLLSGNTNVGVRRCINHIDKTVDRISGIITSLSKISGEKQEHLDQCDVKDALRKSLSIVKDRLSTDEVEVRITSLSSVVVQCHLVSLCQVFTNILDNAIYEIQHDQEKWIKFEYSVEEDTVKIAISNSGKKITDQLAESIFDPFFTTKPVGKGMGLGLALSKSLLVSHGGDLLVDTARDHTTFIICLKTESQTDAESLQVAS